MRVGRGLRGRRFEWHRDRWRCVTTPGQKGGTLFVINTGPHNGLDPQASYVGADLEFASRVYARSLVTYSVGDDAKLIPDLATDTGQMSDGGKTWTFTLVDTAKWQDGQKVTCDDVKYGISRTFATDVISNGPTYILNFLDVPSDADGSPAYKGPYKDTGQADFDKAITCAGQTLTLHFKKPWADFNYAVASLAAYSPVRKDKDKGDKSLFDVFSNGPYQLEGTFDPNKGGTWVRNPNWDEKTDPVRKALPDKIVDIEGIQSEQIYQRLLADGGDDKNAITFVTAPASILPQIVSNPSAAQRATNPAAPFVDYIQPNVTSRGHEGPQGPPGLRHGDQPGRLRHGQRWQAGHDAELLRLQPRVALLQQGLQPVRRTHARATRRRRRRSCRTPARRCRSPSRWSTGRRRPATPSLAALKQTWDQAGFNVTLDGVASSGYYRTISAVAQKSKDAFWASWGADWPSGSTVLPPLFDGRINLTRDQLQPGLRLVQQRRRQRGDRRGLPDPRHRRP